MATASRRTAGSSGEVSISCRMDAQLRCSCVCSWRMRMIVRVLVLAVRMRARRFRIARIGGDFKAQARKPGPIFERRRPAFGGRAEIEDGDSLAHGGPMFRKRVEQGRGEHVARPAAQRVHVDFEQKAPPGLRGRVSERVGSMPVPRRESATERRIGTGVCLKPSTPRSPTSCRAFSVPVPPFSPPAPPC